MRAPAKEIRIIPADMREKAMNLPRIYSGLHNGFVITMKIAFESISRYIELTTRRTIKTEAANAVRAMYERLKASASATILVSLIKKVRAITKRINGTNPQNSLSLLTS